MSDSTDEPALRCPICGASSFDRHEARQDTRWGFTSHRILMLVCQNCSYILHFYRHESIFNFD